MILVDANLLVYAYVSGMPQHAAARNWLDARLNAAPRVGLPWETLLAFVRIVANPRIFERPPSVPDAWRQVEDWLSCEPVWIPQETGEHRRILGSLLQHSTGRAGLVPDAHLAALAIEHGLILCSTDGDFARFPGLRWKDPLLASPPA